MLHTSVFLTRCSSKSASACHWSLNLQRVCMLPCHGRLSTRQYPYPEDGILSKCNQYCRMLDPRCCTCIVAYQPSPLTNNTSTFTTASYQAFLPQYTVRISFPFPRLSNWKTFILNYNKWSKNLAKGRIAVLSPLEATNGFVQPWPLSNV